MGQQILTVFPGMTSPASRIAVDVERNLGHINLRYEVTGAIDKLRLPPFASPGRTDELWKHTCFEAFIRPLPGDAYFEFNLAPSTQWAAYGFTGTRTGMHNADATPTRIEVEQSPETYVLEVTLDLSRLPAWSDEANLRLNISAVIEGTDGRKSYWALAHPADKPDFHNPDCFTLGLPPA
jgi:hypothetical protein